MQRIGAFSDTIGPGRHIADNRRAARPRRVTGQAGRVVGGLAVYRGRRRGANGGQGRHGNTAAGRAAKAHLTHGPDARFNRGALLVGELNRLRGCDAD